MFEMAEYLGQGSFGDVLKVKCLESTCLSETHSSLRCKMGPTAVRKAKLERARLELAAGRSTGTKLGVWERPLFADDHYVVKVINVADLDQKA